MTFLVVPLSGPTYVVCEGPIPRNSHLGRRIVHRGDGVQAECMGCL